MNPWQDVGRELKDRPGTPVHETHLPAAKPAGASYGAPRRKDCRFPDYPNPWGLAPSHCACMLLVVQDLTTKEIAAKLGMMPKTVDAHFERIRASMGTRTRLQAAVLWDRFTRSEGEVPEPDEGVLLLKWRGGHTTVRLS